MNRLVEIDYPGSGNKSELVFDAFGRNVSIKEYTNAIMTDAKKFVWNSKMRAECRDDSGSVTSVLYGLGQQANGTNEYFTKDHLASNRDVSDMTGKVQSTFYFDNFGRSVCEGSVMPEFTFASLYHHRRTGSLIATYRVYNPSIGRWMNRDPIQEAGGLNLYSYAGGDPVSVVDPFGLDPISGLAQKLTDICNDPDCNSGNLSDCLTQAKNIAQILETMIDYYSDPNKKPGQDKRPGNVNGYMCWDWAKGFDDALTDKMGTGPFSKDYAFLKNPKADPDTQANSHYAIKLTTCNKPKCTVFVDDGFFNNTGNVHPAPWKIPSPWEYGGAFEPVGQTQAMPMPE